MQIAERIERTYENLWESSYRSGCQLLHRIEQNIRACAIGFSHMTGKSMRPLTIILGVIGQ